MPGVDLAIGAGFSDLIRLGIHTIPSDSGLVDLNIPLVPALGGMDFYFQALNLDFPLPLTVSNLQSVSLF